MKDMYIEDNYPPIPSLKPANILSKPEGEKYQKMIDMICEQLHFTSLRYHRIDDMIKAIGLPADKICTYCWSGEE